MAKKKTVFLHIGTNKTGTSSIQHHFFQNRDLLASHGICYPGLGQDAAAHHELLSWVTHPKKHEKHLKALRKEIAPFDTTIISSESLCDLEKPETLKEVFAGYDIRIILYLRDPVRYLLSWWQQDIQMGKRYPDMSQYLVTKRRSYIELVDRWVEVFGKANVTTHVYDRQQLPKGDVLLDFKNITGTSDIEGMQRLPWDNNPSVSGNLLYFKLVYNTLRLPDATSQKMIDGLTDASKLDSTFRIVPKVPEILAAGTRRIYNEELKELRDRHGVEVPTTRSIDGVRIPELDTIRRDFRKVMEFSEEKGLPLAEMAKYVKF